MTWKPDDPAHRAFTDNKGVTRYRFNPKHPDNLALVDEVLDEHRFRRCRNETWRRGTDSGTFQVMGFAPYVQKTDLHSIGVIALERVAKTFTPTRRSEWPGYVKTAIRNDIVRFLKYIRKSGATYLPSKEERRGEALAKQHWQGPHMRNDGDDEEIILDRMDYQRQYEKIRRELTDPEWRVVQLFYFQDRRDFEDIGDDQKISARHARRIFDSATEKLMKYGD